MTQYEYITATSGHVQCACLECMNTTVGDVRDEVLCWACEDAGCMDHLECQRDDAMEEC